MTADRQAPRAHHLLARVQVKAPGEIGGPQAVVSSRNTYGMKQGWRERAPLVPRLVFPSDHLGLVCRVSPLA